MSKSSRAKFLKVVLFYMAFLFLVVAVSTFLIALISYPSACDEESQCNFIEHIVNKSDTLGFYAAAMLFIGLVNGALKIRAK